MILLSVIKNKISRINISTYGCVTSVVIFFCIFFLILNGDGLNRVRNSVENNWDPKNF